MKKYSERFSWQFPENIVKTGGIALLILQGFPRFIKQGKENVLQNNEKKKGNPRDKFAWR